MYNTYIEQSGVYERGALMTSKVYTTLSREQRQAYFERYKKAAKP